MAAVSVPSTDRYLPDRKGICGICSGSDPGSDRFLAGQDYLEQGSYPRQSRNRATETRGFIYEENKTDKNSGRIFALMLLFTFLSRAADSVNVAQVETKTAQNQVITHE